MSFNSSRWKSITNQQILGEKKNNLTIGNSKVRSVESLKKKKKSCSNLYLLQHMEQNIPQVQCKITVLSQNPCCLELNHLKLCDSRAEVTKILAKLGNGGTSLNHSNIQSFFLSGY